MASVLGVLAVFLFTRTIIAYSGLPDRFGNNYQSWILKNSSALECQSHRLRRFDLETCVLGPATAVPEIVFWSDSHGMEIANHLAKRLAEEKRWILGATNGGCPPVLSPNHDRVRGCGDFNKYFLSKIAKSPNIKTVIMTMYFGHKRVSDTVKIKELEDTVRTLRRHGKRVILIGPVPKPEYSVSLGLARRAAYQRTDVLAGLPLSAHIAENGKRMEAVVRVAAVTGSVAVDPTSVLCDAQMCDYAIGANTMYIDDNHLSPFAARRVVEVLLTILRK